jgi:hypothetical protein
MAKTIVDTLAEATNLAADEIGMKIDRLEAGVGGGGVKTEESLKGMNSRVNEIFAMIKALKEAQDATTQRVIIKSWFEEE